MSKKRLGEERQPVECLPRAIRDHRLMDIRRMLIRGESIPKWAVDSLVGGVERTIFGLDPWPADETKWRKVGGFPYKAQVPLGIYTHMMHRLFGGMIDRKQAVREIQRYGVSRSTAYRLTQLPGPSSTNTAAEALCGIRYRPAEQCSEQHTVSPGTFVPLNRLVDDQIPIHIVSVDRLVQYKSNSDYRVKGNVIEILKNGNIREGGQIQISYRSSPSLSVGL